MSRSILVIAVAVVLAGLGVAAYTELGDRPRHGVPEEALAPEATGDGGVRRYALGDAVTLDVTTFLDGKPWKTTKPWVGELLYNATLADGKPFNASRYTPLELVVGAPDPANPLLEELARSVEGRYAGEHFTVHVATPYGTKDDIQKVTVPRVYGPYPAETTWSADDFQARFGDARPGGEVQTNRLFNSTVVDVTGHHVVTRSKAVDGGVVAVPQVNAFLRVSVDDAGVRFVLDPVENVSFKVLEDRTYFGLAPGNYVVSEVTEDSVVYDHHPLWSPILLGLSFDLEVDIQE